MVTFFMETFDENSKCTVAVASHEADCSAQFPAKHEA